ncbi:alcohol dehydrogenase [Xylona heveae TC161]|uniref:Alcohol dehydrogenase n=1 Tax=Xylona heveae (strain CBS 132557 / TC161) TaxID=1328760 RepID=A0A165H3S5_XYLHT|nr:alcohol dehydrogenase [Xylona heveae TC161]KZF22945.1 alcohol dehydrogenase [Xylona heveae TC161]
MPLTNKQLIYTRKPTPSINPSVTSNGDGTFELRTSTFPDPAVDAIPENKILVRMLYLSLDPAMRQWLTAKRSYIAPVKLGEIMRGQGIVEIIGLGKGIDTNKFKIGQYARAATGWQEYALLPTDRNAIEPLGPLQTISTASQASTGPKTNQPQIRATDFLSTLGTTGLTAYFGFLHVGKFDASRDKTVVISGAAGATGMVVGQIARLKGAKRVIGLAGTRVKCEFLVNELGFDKAINYKDTDWKKQLLDATPEYIDVYFDNVGGEILDACLLRANQNARFVMCGAISQYNTGSDFGGAGKSGGSGGVRGLQNYMMIISQRVTLQGFIVFDYVKEYPRALKDLSAWLEQGKIKRREHVIKGGLEAAPAGLVGLFAGENIGKTMVEVASVSGSGSSSSSSHSFGTKAPVAKL